MTVLHSNEPRVIVPRWREAHDVANTAEAQPATGRSVPQNPNTIELHRRISDWRRNGTPAFAADAVASAVALGFEAEVKDIAETILSDSAATQQARLVAKRALGRGEQQLLQLPYRISQESAAARIRKVKDRLREDGRNPLLWSDLARLYASLGQERKAERAMTVAIGMFPSNRVLLRAASRLSVEIQKPDWGRHLLLRSARTRSDPWLMAAEIALSSKLDATSSSLRGARKILASGAFTPAHLSELASAIATVEYESGATKLARRLLRQSLEEPTDNSVAQAESLIRGDTSVEVPQHLLNLPLGFEARAIHSFHQGDWSEAARQSGLWLQDEPFAERPASSGSFVCSVALADFERGLEFSSAGLRANPEDWLLLNNEAFALASLGRLDEAEVRLRRALVLAPPREVEVAVTATKGLVEFRRGRFQAGRDLYQSAIAAAQRMRMPFSAALAQAFLAREEVFAHTSSAQSARNRVDELIGTLVAPDLNVLKVLVETQVDSSPAG